MNNPKVFRNDETTLLYFYNFLISYNYFLIGLVIARRAIATHYSTREAPLTEDVSNKELLCILTIVVVISGCHYGLWVFRCT